MLRAAAVSEKPELSLVSAQFASLCACPLPSNTSTTCNHHPPTSPKFYQSTSSAPSHPYRGFLTTGPSRTAYWGRVVRLLLLRSGIESNPGPASVKILQWNAGGLSNPAKRAELLKLLCDDKIDVAAIQESHWQPHQQPKFPGYTVYRKDRTTGRVSNENLKGGGVVTLIRRGLQHQELSDVNILNNGDITTDAVSVRVLSKKPITLHNIYVPPNQELHR